MKMMKFVHFLFIILFSFQSFAQDLVPYRKFSNWGFSDINGKLIIQPQYQRAWFFQSNGLAVVKSNDRQSLINKKGQIITKKDYAIIGILSKEKIIAARRVNGRGSELYYSDWVNISLTGEELTTVPSKADIVQLTVEKNSAPAICNIKSTEAALEKNQFVLYLNDGILLTTGTLQCLTENLFIAEAIIEKGVTRFGVIDGNLNVKIPFKFSSIIGLINNYIHVSLNGKRGIYSLEGKEIIAPKYGNILQIADDFALVQLSSSVKNDETVGYVGLNGREYFESNPVYQVSTIDNHLTITDQYYNRIGFPIIDFEEANVINNKLVWLIKDGKQFLYSIDGDLLLEANKINQLDENRFLAESNSILSVYNSKELKLEYDSLQFTSLISDPYSNIEKGYFFKNHAGKNGAINSFGQMVVQPYYKSIIYNGKYFLAENDFNEFILLDSLGNTLKHFGKSKVHYLSYYFFSVHEKDKNSIYDARNNSIIYNNLIPVETQTEINAGIIQNTNKLYGYLNPNSETVVDPIYSDAGYFQTYNHLNPYLIIYYFKKKNGKYDLYNTSTGKFIAVDLDQVKKPITNWLPVYKSNRLSFVDVDGNLILEDGIEDFNPTTSTNYLALKKNGKFGVLNTSKELVFDFKYQNISGINDDFVIATQNNQVGLLDINDSIWIPFQYASLVWLTTLEDTIGETYLFMAEKNGKKGIVDQFNKQLTPFDIEGEVSFPFTKNYFVVTSNGKSSLFDKSNQVILKNIGDEITSLNLEDENGNEIAIVQNGKKYGLYNTIGKCMAPIEFDRVNTETNYYDFYERFYTVIEKNGKSGFVSLESGITCPPQFDVLFPEGLTIMNKHTYLPVKLKNKWGILKDFRSLLIPCIYDEIDLNEANFNSGIIKLKLNGKSGIADSTGKLLLPCDYNEIIIGEEINGEFILEVIKNEKHGIFHSRKGIIINPEYDKIGVLYLNQPIYTALKGKYFAVIHSSGKVILPCEMVKPIKSQDTAFPFIFQDKNGKKWGLNHNLEAKELN